MTCIVGMISNDKIYMGADSCTTVGALTFTKSEPKIFEKRGYLFGTAGSTRVSQVVHYLFNPPEGNPTHVFMLEKLVSALKKCLKDNDIVINEKENQFQMLVGVYGKLFLINDGFDVFQPSCGYIAAGNGRSVALGALHAVINNNLCSDPEKILQYALTASAELNDGVSAPFDIKSV